MVKNVPEFIGFNCWERERFKPLCNNRGPLGQRVVHVLDIESRGT